MVKIKLVLKEKRQPSYSPLLVTSQESRFGIPMVGSRASAIISSLAGDYTNGCMC